MPASEVVDATEHLLHAALQRRLLLQFVAQLAAGEFLHLDLAAALGGNDLGELLDAHAGRVVGVVQVAELDRPLLDVLGQRGRAGSDQAEQGRQLDQCAFHVVSWVKR